MASWLRISAIDFDPQGLELPPPRDPLIGVQTRSQSSQLNSASHAFLPTPTTSSSPRTQPITRCQTGLSAMASKSSSHSSGSRRLQPEQPGDDDWLTSTECGTTTKTTEIQVFRFMDLPEELRRLTYSFLLSIPPGEEFQLDQSIVDWSFFAASDAAILCVSKEIYLDAFPVFLRENKFLIGTSLTNPHIFRSFGPKRCVYLRTLSIQLNDRPVRDSLQLLDELSEYCEELRQLELRVSPGSPFLPHLTSIFAARTQAASSSRTHVVLRFSVKKVQTIFAWPYFAVRHQDELDRAAEDIKQSFQIPFRWPKILQRAHEITIKGCINRDSLDVLEDFQYEGWHFAKKVTMTVENCTTTQENVTRRWEPMDNRRVMELDERHPQRWA